MAIALPVGSLLSYTPSGLVYPGKAKTPLTTVWKHDPSTAFVVISFSIKRFNLLTRRYKVPSYGEFTFLAN